MPNDKLTTASALLRRNRMTIKRPVERWVMHFLYPTVSQIAAEGKDMEQKGTATS